MYGVAPLAGAWIEIIPEPPPRSMRLSHPLRVRGLKCRMGRRKRRRKIVAPLAGAWIEMTSVKWNMRMRAVAPLAGAWIEISEKAYREECHSSRTPCGCVD